MFRTGWTLVLVLGLCGFLLLTAAFSTSRSRRAEQPRRQRLAALVQSRRGQLHTLDRQVRNLRTQVVQAQAVGARRDRAEVSRSKRLSRLAAEAGAIPMEGPGLEVRLSDSTRKVPARADPAVYRIHDRDLQLIVNALLAAGAEAVSVNDVRLVATSPIRAAGETIVASFRPLSPPYVMRAIGAREAPFEASREAGLFARWHDAFGLGFDVDEQDHLHVPAFTGHATLSLAQPG